MKQLFRLDDISLREGASGLTLSIETDGNVTAEAPLDWAGALLLSQALQHHAGKAWPR